VFLLVATASGSRLVRRSGSDAAAAAGAAAAEDVQIHDDVIGQGRTYARGRAIVGHGEGLSALPDGSPRRLPRMIWSAWLQGDPNCTAPYLNNMCMHFWSGMNSNTWNFTMLTYRKIYQVFPELREVFEREPRTRAAQSDLVRLYFLSKFGGVWVDASVLPVLRLDSFIDGYVEPSGFFWV
jgi:hypothetical protein